MGTAKEPGGIAGFKQMRLRSFVEGPAIETHTGR
jgi:hypothetical protein